MYKRDELNCVVPVFRSFSILYAAEPVSIQTEQQVPRFMFAIPLLSTPMTANSEHTSAGFWVGVAPHVCTAAVGSTTA